MFCSKVKKIVRIALSYMSYLKCKNSITFDSLPRPLLYRGTNIQLLMGAHRDQLHVGEGGALLCNILLCKNGTFKSGNYVQIGPGTRIECVSHIEIGDNTTISRNVIISDNNNHPVNPIDRLQMSYLPLGAEKKQMYYSVSCPIKIGNTVWIGENARICKGVTIGDGSIVAANSIVTKDVPSNCIAAGNPAKIVKTNIETTPRIYID